MGSGWAGVLLSLGLLKDVWERQHVESFFFFFFFRTMLAEMGLMVSKVEESLLLQRKS